MLSDDPELAKIFTGKTALSQLYERTMSSPFNNTKDTGIIPFFVGYREYIQGKQINMHSAGGDAFATGWVFFQLSHYLGKNQNGYNGIHTTGHLTKYLNTVHVMRSDVNLVLSADTLPKQDRSLIFYVQGLSPSVTSNSLKPILGKFGSFQISPIDTNNAYIRICNHSKAKMFAQQICNHDFVLESQLDQVKDFRVLQSQGVSIMPFDEAYDSNILFSQISSKSSDLAKINPKKRGREEAEIEYESYTEDERPRKVQKSSSCLIM